MSRERTVDSPPDKRPRFTARTSNVQPTPVQSRLKFLVKFEAFKRERTWYRQKVTRKLTVVYSRLFFVYPVHTTLPRIPTRCIYTTSGKFIATTLREVQLQRKKVQLLTRSCKWHTFTLCLYDGNFGSSALSTNMSKLTHTGTFPGKKNSSTQISIYKQT